MVASPPLTRISVAEAVDRYLTGVRRAVAGKSLSQATAANYERDLAEFVDLVGAETVLDDLTAEDVDDAVLAYGAKPDGRYARPQPGKTRGAGAQARFRQSVSRLFSEAVLSGWVEASPMPRTKVRPRAKGLENVARRALPLQAAQPLLDTPQVAAASDSRVPKDRRTVLRDQFLLRLLVEAGPRVSEICSADRGHFEHREDGTRWLYLMGKGGKERWVPVTDTTWALYERYVEEERPAPAERTMVDRVSGERVVTATVDDAERALVLTWRGLRMTKRDVQLMVQRSAKRLPPEVRRHVTPHGLRHTAATLLLSSGAADIKTVKELLGHASIATTGVYLDTVAEELAAAVRMHPVNRTRDTA